MMCRSPEGPLQDELLCSVDHRMSHSRATVLQATRHSYGQAKILFSVTLCSLDRSLPNLVCFITSSTPTHRPMQILV